MNNILGTRFFIFAIKVEIRVEFKENVRERGKGGILEKGKWIINMKRKLISTKQKIKTDMMETRAHTNLTQYSRNSPPLILNSNF